MATLVFAMPIVPGKEAIDRENIQRMAAPGPEHDEFVPARQAAGITREAVWHQSTPDGTMSIVLMESDDLEGAFRHMASADGAFARRFRDQVMEVHGFDLASDPPPSVDLISDVSI